MCTSWPGNYETFPSELVQFLLGKERNVYFPNNGRINTAAYQHPRFHICDPISIFSDCKSFEDEDFPYRSAHRDYGSLIGKL